MQVTPNYYNKFKCIAGECKHTCCAGWEIDIDEEALKRYKNIKGDLGKKLSDQIIEDECPHFKLTEEERCPFLDKQNLCELILHGGEEMLCQICSDHPRFRNEFAGREEMGLGLCCEAAGALILGWKEKVHLIGGKCINESVLDPLDAQILEMREQAFRIVQNRKCPIEERAQQLLDEMDVQIPELSNKEWVSVFRNLERMDPEWDTCLNKIETAGILEGNIEWSNLEIPLEQLLVYFLYRHVPQAEDVDDIPVQIGYAWLGYKVICKLCSIKAAEEGVCSLEDLIEFARLYSSEIEYSEENTDALLELIWEENAF